MDGVCPKCNGRVDVDDAYCRRCGRSLHPTWSRLAGRGDGPKPRRRVHRKRTERFRFRNADGTERVYDRIEDVPTDLRRRLGGIQEEVMRMLAGGIDDVTLEEDAHVFTYEVMVEDAGAGALELLENIRSCFGDLPDDSIADDG